MAQTLSSDEVLQCLRSVFNPLAEQVRWVASGWFSQAFSFLVGEKVFIIRLNPYEEDFRDYWSEDIPYAELWRQHAVEHDWQVPYFAERKRCYQLHNILNDLAVAAIQGNRDNYQQVRERLHVMTPLQKG